MLFVASTAYPKSDGYTASDCDACSITNPHSFAYGNSHTRTNA